MAVGFWNLVGADMFGFLPKLPIVSYFDRVFIIIGAAPLVIASIKGYLGVRVADPKERK